MKKAGMRLPASPELRARIEEKGRQIQGDYGKALETVQNLKEKINKLEQQTLEGQRSKALNLPIRRLNRVTDSQIMRSKKAWKDYRKLEQECRQSGLCPFQLDNLKAVCKKTEELAADLLCYSLARFKQSEGQS